MINLKLKLVVLQWNESINSTKYLGMFLDSKLKFKDHIDYLIKKVNSFKGICYKAIHFLPFECRRNLYFAYIYPLILYGLYVYGMCTKTLFQDLCVAVNKLLRVLQGLPRDSPTAELYTNFNTLPLNLLLHYVIIKLVYQSKHDFNISNTISRLFISNNNIHNYSTCSCNKLHVQSSMITKYNSCVNIGTLLWNSLPNNLTSILSFNVFYNHLCKYLQESN